MKKWSMNNLIFLPEAWSDYVFWQKENKNVLRRINLILRDIARDAFHGIGKPEPLRGNLTGWWSRRIDMANRLVYRIRENGDIEIAECRGHYTA